MSFDIVFPCSDKNGFKVLPNKNISEKTIEKVSAAANEVGKLFPILSQYTEAVSFGDAKGALAINRFDLKTGTNTITLYEKAFSDPDGLLNILKSDHISGKSYDTDHIESLVAHEMGHNAHIALALRRSGLKYGVPLGLIEREIFDISYNRIAQDVYFYIFKNETYEEIQSICIKELGKMTERDPRELIAQGFGNYFYGKIRSETAFKIIEFFKKELNDNVQQ